MDKLRRRWLLLRYNLENGTPLHVVGESPDAVLLSTEAHPTRGEFVAIDLGDLLLLSPDEQVGRLARAPTRDYRQLSPQA